MKKETKTKNESGRPNLLIVASPGARSTSYSPLLRFVRDNASTLKMFRLHTTQGTGDRVYGTGLFSKGEITYHRGGKDGGIAQLAAMVARGECIAVIMLLDPRDPWCDAVENRALKRVCIQLKVLLITTYAAAKLWFTKEVAENLIKSHGPERGRKPWRPKNWRKGTRNVDKNGEPINLLINERTLALISHDGKKSEMIGFVNNNSDLLANHQRILTTGTTGWLLRLIMSDDKRRQSLLREARSLGLEKRLKVVILDILKKKDEAATLEGLLSEFCTLREIEANNIFVSKVMPLPSGPAGGDALVADSILKTECHSIVFLHDPATAHPHSADIRLLENTAQLPGSFSECVSDISSANRWARRLELELKLERMGRRTPDYAHELRQAFGLHEVVLIDMETNKDSDELGQALARACAGFFNQQLLHLSDEIQGIEFGRRSGDRKVRIGISWGWGAREVLTEIKRLEEEGLLERPGKLPRHVLWSPAIGTIMSEITDREASIIAQQFAEFYGGKVSGFPFAGFAGSQSPRPALVDELEEGLSDAEIILTTAAPWNKDSSLYRHTGLDASRFPSPGEAVGLVSGVFLDKEGNEVTGDYSIVGLGFKGFRKAARRGAVILMCGGDDRLPIIRAALKAKLASTLITTTTTCRDLLADVRSRKD